MYGVHMHSTGVGPRRRGRKTFCLTCTLFYSHTPTITHKTILDPRVTRNYIKGAILVVDLCLAPVHSPYIHCPLHGTDITAARLSITAVHLRFHPVFHTDVGISLVL